MDELTNSEINIIQKLISEKITKINLSYEQEYLITYRNILQELYLKLNKLYNFEEDE